MNGKFNRQDGIVKKLCLSATLVIASIIGGISNSNQANAEVTQCVEVTALPATISAPGVYCLKKNLGTNITSGAAVTITANNVTFEMNGYRLGGATAGLGTTAVGVESDGRKNIIIRNGAIRGFFRGIFLDGNTSTSSGHIVEDMLMDGNRNAGIFVTGRNTTIRNNKVTNTGPGDFAAGAFGIYSFRSSGVDITNNIVSGLDETNEVIAITVQDASDVNVSNNRVFDLNNAVTKRGIITFTSNRVVVRNNVVSSGNGGAIAIGEVTNTSNLACVGNAVSGFSSNFSGCDILSENVPF